MCSGLCQLLNVITQFIRKMKMDKILLVKDFSGDYNDNGIGHEIINYYDRNNNKTDYYYFYVPPYGTVGKRDESFVDGELYKSVKYILVFDSTNITNVLKLKSIVVDPVCFEAFDEINDSAKKALYGPKNKALNEINFNYQNEYSDDDDNQFISYITYKVKKDKYYDFSNENIFIWHSRNQKTDALLKQSKEKMKFAYGDNYSLKILSETKVGQKNYIYNLGKDLYSWFETDIKPHLTDEKLFVLKEIGDIEKAKYEYDEDNIIAFLDKIKDENIYTNFIYKMLIKNSKLKDEFFSFLVDKLFSIKQYKPSNCRIEKQWQALTEEKKISNSYSRNKQAGNEKATEKAEKQLKARGYTDQMLEEIKDCYADGMIDLYLFDDKYQIVIENKIMSGINGKRDTVDGQINQLNTYRTYIDDVRPKSADENIVALLVPNQLSNKFANYTIEYGNPKISHTVKAITYKDLSKFFTDHKSELHPAFADSFLQILYKQSYTKDEDILNRFTKVLD